MASVIIEHRDGRRYGIEEADFTVKLLLLDGIEQTYQAAGFVIVASFEGGQLYTPELVRAIPPKRRARGVKAKGKAKPAAVAQPVEKQGALEIERDALDR